MYVQLPSAREQAGSCVNVCMFVCTYMCMHVCKRVGRRLRQRQRLRLWPLWAWDMESQTGDNARCSLRQRGAFERQCMPVAVE